ncbi:MAG: putative transcriptional regulatory protein (TetR-family) [Nocardia sp.]|uniref:TetR/AcrR family transcriptional regulator n=1 Tax=Nocardia sp. TaxID=1821 RepID=UPI00261FF543|nr:TetR/AcrR family transcriptional regulator [Nocardia sp.]MCU1640297.1 putative transcriptional regulatory protein (TetR-family) [Nocardia sp.]
MSTARPRRVRGEGEQLRGELVTAAIDLLLEPQALPAPSLRAIARASGVAPSAVYMHFPSQEALMYAVTEELFGRLRTALDAGEAGEGTPAARLRSLIGAYLQWSRDYPGAYQLLFERPDPAIDSGTGPGLDLLDRFADLLQVAGAGADRTLSLRIWSVLHGIASLRIHKPTAPWTSTPEDEAWAIIQTIGELP